MASKRPSYLQEDEWGTYSPDPTQPELWRSTYSRYANAYGSADPIQGTITVTVDDYGQYYLNWSANYEVAQVVAWNGDQKTLDAVRKLVAAGVRKAVTEANGGGRAERKSDWAEWGSDWRTWRGKR